jgi:hypothetical protein
MTALNTAIYVQGKQDPWEMYNITLQQALFYDGRNTAPSDIHYHLSSEADGREIIYASPHENLPVMLAVYHRPGADMFTEQEAKDRLDPSCGNPDCDVHQAPAAHLIVALASPLSWGDEKREGWNAGNLHSGMVWGIGGFLDAKGIPWKWQHNVSHEVFEGYDALDGLPPAVERTRMGMANPMGLAQEMAREFMKRMGLLREED